MRRDDMDRPGYERSDVGGRGVLLGVGAASLVVVLTIVLLWALARAVPPEVAPSVAEPPPPLPGFEADVSVGRDATRRPLLELRRRERDLLEGWQWLDRTRRHARIPVERAAEILAGDPELLERTFGPGGTLAAPETSDAAEVKP